MTPIEYIGPAPTKKRKKPVLGGWIIMLLAGLFVSYFAWPSFADYVLKSEEAPSADNVEETVARLTETNQYGDRLAAAALRRTTRDIVYDAAEYNNIGYPNGDIPEGRGTCTDLIIRSYRVLNIDLQQLVHEDMKAHFLRYPQLWDTSQPDSDIDHRRVPNLKRFFERHGKTLEPSRATEDYSHGDIVIWRLPNGRAHIGIVVPGPGSQFEEKWIVHNIGKGPVWSNELLDYEITGHFRYQGH